MVWKLDLHRDSTKPQKNRGLDFAPKKVTFKNNGGDLPRGPPRVRASKLVGKPWGLKIPRENQRRFPRKDPWAECGVGEVEALQEAKMGFFRVENGSPGN